MKSIAVRNLIIVGLLAGAWLSPAFAQQNAGKKEYEFRGKVEKVDAKAKKLTVNGEKVEGWMQAMTMMYKVDKDDVLKTVKPGDQIVAKVYDGDQETLYNVQRVPPKNGAEPSKK